MAEKEKLPGKNRVPLEVSYRHLPVTPFHASLQKVRSYLAGCIGNRWNLMTPKYSFGNGESRGKCP
jgi:hypothetical protein